jgi:hypothetical protein
MIETTHTASHGSNRPLRCESHGIEKLFISATLKNPITTYATNNPKGVVMSALTSTYRIRGECY